MLYQPSLTTTKTTTTTGGIYEPPRTEVVLDHTAVNNWAAQLVNEFNALQSAVSMLRTDFDRSKDFMQWLALAYPSAHMEYVKTKEVTARLDKANESK